MGSELDWVEDPPDVDWPVEDEPEEDDGSHKSYRQLVRYFRKDIRKRRGTLIGGALFGVVYAAARVAVTGPLMADGDHERLVRLTTRFGVEVRRVVPELRREVATADCIVAMAGYNTVCDVLSYRRPAVLVPRSGPNHEQSLRTAWLESWNAAEIVRPHELSSHEMARAIRSALSRGAPPAPPVPLDGFQNTLDILDTALAQARAA